MTARDLFLSSAMARPWTHRLAVAGAVIAGLWLAISWAVSLP